MAKVFKTSFEKAKCPETIIRIFAKFKNFHNQLVQRFYSTALCASKQIDKEGYLYVCDRENHRIQVFNHRGEFEALWANVHRPCAIYIDKLENIYVAELGYGVSTSKNVPNIGPRISVLNKKGQVVQRIGHNGYGMNKGQFIAPHGICLDSNLDIYVAEVARTNISHFMEPPESVRSFQKLKKVV